MIVDEIWSFHNFECINYVYIPKKYDYIASTNQDPVSGFKLCYEFMQLHNLCLVFTFILEFYQGGYSS